MGARHNAYGIAADAVDIPGTRRSTVLPLKPRAARFASCFGRGALSERVTPACVVMVVRLARSGTRSACRPTFLARLPDCDRPRRALLVRHERHPTTAAACGHRCR